MATTETQRYRPKPLAVDLTKTLVLILCNLAVFMYSLKLKTNRNFPLKPGEITGPTSQSRVRVVLRQGQLDAKISTNKALIRAGKF